MTINKPLITFKDAALGYSKKTVLRSINFQIYQGDSLGIIGPNGAGKTTLLKAILGQLKPQSGLIQYDQSDVRFGYVVQRQMVDEIFPLSVEEVVIMGRYGQIGPGRRVKKKDRNLAYQAMEITGIKSLASRLYRNLSGGQKQRTLIARALICEANVLVLDEPTNDMDISGELQIMELIKKIHEEQKVTILIVSHLLHNIINYVKRIALVNDSSVSIHSLEEGITEKRLSGVFGNQMSISEISGRKVVITNGNVNRNI